jgi:DNA-binding IclR family transcriptional regulator
MRVLQESDVYLHQAAIARRAGLSRFTAEKHLRKLIQEGKVQERTAGKYTVYGLKRLQ